MSLDFDPLLLEQTERWINDYNNNKTHSVLDWTASTIRQFKKIPISTLLVDDYFLGLEGRLYDAVYQDIVDLWEERKKRPVNLAVFLEGIGSGKSLKSSIIIWLLWFELCMYENPQKHFGMINNSVLSIMLLSRSEKQSRRVVFNYCWERFQTGFNKDYFPANPRYTSEIRIDRNTTCVYAGTSSAMSALGYNVYCISGTQKIRLANGKNVEAKVLANKGPIRLMGFDLEKTLFKEVSADNIINTGEKEIFEVILTDGSIVECTEYHKFLTSKPIVGYKALKDCTEKDEVVSEKDFPIKIKAIKSLGVQEVYDIINSDTSNFMLDSGIIIKNSAVIDEANFLEVTEDSKKAEEDFYDAGEEMYNAVNNRMTSRFMKQGKIPGIISLISSPRYPDSFLERKIKEAEALGEENLNMFWRRRSLWEAKGPKYFNMGSWFEVDTETLKIVKEHKAKKGIK